MKWEGEEILKEIKGGAKLETSPFSREGRVSPRHQRESVAVSPRPPHVVAKLGHLASLAPLALLSRSSVPFGHPNSKFESVFRL